LNVSPTAALSGVTVSLVVVAASTEAWNDDAATAGAASTTTACGRKVLMANMATNNKVLPAKAAKNDLSKLDLIYIFSFLSHLSAGVSMRSQNTFISVEKQHTNVLSPGLFLANHIGQ